jgi:positive regulator of sigma E activity
MKPEIVDTGFVSRIIGDKAYVKMAAQEACSSCGARIICAPDGPEDRELLLTNTIGAKVGDEVAITESGNQLLKLSVLQYGIPLFGFIAGIFFSAMNGYRLPQVPQELLMFMTGVAGMLTGGVCSWLWARNWAKKPDPGFEMLQIF